jgi:hypothetical protein
MQHKHTHVDREAGHSKEAGHRRYLPRPNTASPEYSLARIQPRPNTASPAILFSVPAQPVLL